MNQNDVRKSARFVTKVIAWYFIPGKSKILTQLVDLSETGLCMNAESFIPKGEKINLELQFPTSFPKITKITGEIINSNEILQGILYHLHVKFNALDPESKSEIDKFISLHQKELAPIKSQTQEHKPNLSPDQLKHILPAIIKLVSDQTIFQCHFTGNVISTSLESIHADVTYLAQSVLVFSCEERFFLNTDIVLDLNMPGSTKPCKLSVTIKKIEEKNETPFEYETVYTIPDSLEEYRVNEWLLTLFIRKLGRKTIDEIITQNTPMSSSDDKSWSEHRKWTRSLCDLDSQLYDEIEFTVAQAHIKDISLGGAKIIFNKEIMPSSHVLLKIKLFNEDIRIPSQVKWNAFLKEKQHYEIGLQFDKLEDRAQKTIGKYLQSLK